MRASLIALIIVASTGVAHAGDFGDANALYESGEFERAAVAYEEIVRSGVKHEDLYYNLGNAYFRVGRLGPAVYNFERALRIDPSHADASFNLEVARDVIAQRFGSRLKGAEPLPLWIRIVTFSSIAKLTLLVLALNFLFFGILIGLRFIAEGFARTSLIVTNIFVGGGLVVVIGLMIGHAYFLERVSMGVVLPDEVVMREGADDRRAERGLLHPGLRVEIVGSDPSGWLRIRLSNGGNGWVKQETIGRL